MPTALQHCPACDEEYVARVDACVECGGVLTAGPLPRLEAPGRRARADRAAAGDPVAADHLLVELPGQEAHLLVRTLLIEGIPCRVRCQGIEKRYAPGETPQEPLAVTLPVSVFVPAGQREAAEDLLAVTEHEDVIGEQWDAEPASALEHGHEPVPSNTEPPADAYDYEPLPVLSPGADADPLQPQGTSWRLVAMAVAIAVVLLYVFTR